MHKYDVYKDSTSIIAYYIIFCDKHHLRVCWTAPKTKE